jgi:hypothetical protein
MSHSVKITTPIPSPEEIAADLGITGKRLDSLLALVDERKKVTAIMVLYPRIPPG